MNRRHPRQDRREGSRKIAHTGAAPMPEGRSLGDLVEAEHFFDAAVAIRCDRKDSPGQRLAIADAHDDIVMKLTLFPVIDELVRSVAGAERFEQGSEDHGIGEGLNG